MSAADYNLELLVLSPDLQTFYNFFKTKLEDFSHFPFLLFSWKLIADQ